MSSLLSPPQYDALWSATYSRHQYTSPPYSSRIFLRESLSSLTFLTPQNLIFFEIFTDSSDIPFFQNPHWQLWHFWHSIFSKASLASVTFLTQNSEFFKILIDISDISDIPFFFKILWYLRHFWHSIFFKILSGICDISDIPIFSKASLASVTFLTLHKTRNFSKSSLTVLTFLTLHNIPPLHPR